MLFSALVLAAALQTPASPISKLHDLVGSWHCTYRAGAMRFAYDATYAYDLDGRTLRETATWQGGGDEELFGYDAKSGGWSAVVFDDHGTATVMRGTGHDADHIAYRSVYPDTSIAETFDRVSASEYMLHATVRMGGKTTASVDTCTRV